MNTSQEGHLRTVLLEWFSLQARPLPWRQTRNPYAIWISEIILQQTSVESGIAHYQHFLEVFPTLDALATASLDTVLKTWEGFGYYTRARNLHKAAQMLQSQGGQLPTTAAGWLALPGIGRYTAGAIASIAFGEPVAAVDGNCRRVLARLFGIRRSIDDADGQKELDSIAASLVPDRHPGDFNQAIMDLGATICVPKRPRCSQCPVAQFCEAFRSGIQDQIPVRKARPTPPHVDEVVAVLMRRGRSWMGQRPHEALLGGLWEFPSIRPNPGESSTQALERLLTSLGVSESAPEDLGTVSHAYSHFSVDLHVYRCPHPEGKPTSSFFSQTKWSAQEDVERSALPGVVRKVLARLKW